MRIVYEVGRRGGAERGHGGASDNRTGFEVGVARFGLQRTAERGMDRHVDGQDGQLIRDDSIAPSAQKLCIHNNNLVLPSPSVGAFYVERTFNTFY